MPKIHKDDVPVKPVLSAIGTYHYDLGKILKQMLSDIVQSKVIIKDSLGFVEGLKSLKDCELLQQCKSRYKMASFGISSLYTNMPLEETVEIVLKHLYDKDKLAPIMKPKYMKNLLLFA